jgi:hypothetical protein
VCAILKWDETSLWEVTMRRDEVQIDEVVAREEIRLGDATLTLNEALALWLWFLAHERDAARGALLEQHASGAAYTPLWREAA